MPDALFVHNGTSGRFRSIAHGLVERGWRCALINGKGGADLPGVRTVAWSIDRGNTPGIFRPAIRAEGDFLRGRGAAEAALKLRAEGFDPRVIIGHPAWGEMLFLAEVFPDARQVQVGEFYYRATGSDADFDPEFGTPDMDERVRIHAKNAALAMSYAAAERIVCPTPFQASFLPPAFQSRIRIIHEGIDTAVARPRQGLRLTLGGDLHLEAGAPVITFVNRVFEPMRGFHRFMRALPAVLGAVPDAQVIMIGTDAGKGYGPSPPPGRTWRQVMQEELAGRLDSTRVHFVGKLSYEQLLAALSISSAHVYMTYPFVLSWSLLDAMACECLVVGSDTAPVRDVIVPGENGLLVDFFDTGALSDALIQACRDPARFAPLRKAARETVLREFDRRTVCDPAWQALVDEVAA